MAEGSGEGSGEPQLGLIILIVSDDPRLARFGPVIEYNGWDAFEMGAVGTGVAPLDGRVEGSPLAQFYFQTLDMYQEGDREHAWANTLQLLEVLEERAAEAPQAASSEGGRGGGGGGGGAPSPRRGGGRRRSLRRPGPRS